MGSGSQPPAAPQRRSIAHTLVLGLVWLAVVSGAVVFTEPAPVDVLTIGLILLLPVVGLVAFKPGLVIFLALWLIAAAAAFGAAAFASDIARASIHSGVSLYLYLSTFVLAGFIAKRPLQHTQLILHAYTWAAACAATAGLIGYFNVVPGAAELFTKFGRATGTFKDPNVFGPFLVPAILYCLQQIIARPLVRNAIPALMLILLSFALLLSFSRGAWISLTVAVTLYGWFSFICSPTNGQRLKLLGLLIAGIFITMIGIGAALQSDDVGRLLEERAQITQSYDEGPEGRFGGHEKAKRLILENPFGIGAGVFTDLHHHEEVHNVYLSMFLNAGWIGGLLFIMMSALTTLYGFRHAFKRTLTQPLFVVVYAAFVGNVVEGIVIDLDHWRHYYLLMALIWGLMLGDRLIVANSSRIRPVTLVGPAKSIRGHRPAKIVRAARRRIGSIPHRVQRRPSLHQQATTRLRYPLR